MAANLFLLLVGYYVVKVAREPLIMPLPRQPSSRLAKDWPKSWPLKASR